MATKRKDLLNAVEVEESAVLEEVKEIKKAKVEEPILKHAIDSKVVNADLGVNVRSEPSINSLVLKILANGTVVQVSELKNGFYKLCNEPGWVMAQFLR